MRDDDGDDGAVHDAVGGVTSVPGDATFLKNGYPSLMAGSMFQIVEKSQPENVFWSLSCVDVLPTPPAPHSVDDLPDVVVFQ